MALIKCNECGQDVSEHALACPHCGNPMAQENKSLANEEVEIKVGVEKSFDFSPQYVYAGFWLRFVALIIDGFVIFGISFVVGIIFGILFAQDGINESTSNILGTIIGWLYFSLMESSSNQGTVGKIAIGLKVVDLNGNRISFLRATGRYFAKILSSITLFIGYIMAGLTEKKQALHDMVASTLVVNK
ncbi:MAG: RDD family protein [Clostridia bacterium]|nr:RDD family protein [Clostridia bacterium]